KAEVGDAVGVGEVVCLIDTSAAKLEGESAKEEKAAKDKAESSEKKKEKPAEKQEEKTEEKPQTYASGTASPAATNVMAEKRIDPQQVKGTGKDGRITKEDAVNAVPSMGTPGSASRTSERKKLSMLRRKVAERLVSVKNDTAMLTTFNEVDMSPIFNL